MPPASPVNATVRTMPWLCSRQGARTARVGG